MRRIALILLLALPLLSIAQDDKHCYITKYFLLIQSTQDYKAALQTAQKAAKGLNIKLDLRGLVRDEHTHIGLSLPADTCEKYSREETGVAESSCYIARGRWDDSIY